MRACFAGAAAAIVTLTERIVRLVGKSPDDAALGVPFGQMTLPDHLTVL
jgi:hypothetical protein